MMDPQRALTGRRTMRDLARYVEDRARAQGPEAVAELEALREWARRERERLEAQDRSRP